VRPGGDGRVRTGRQAPAGRALLRATQVLQQIMRNFFTFIGEVSHFGLKGLVDAFRPPFEWEFFLIQFEEIGWQSLPLILAAGLAIGIVLSMHTRGTLVQFGAEAMIPTLQSASFFNELGPLVTGLLVAGRVGAGIGAGIANMRVTEQIDAIESLSVEAFKMLVVTRIVACVLILPMLTLFMDLASLAGGFLSEYLVSHISLQLYLDRAFKTVEWANFIPPTLKTSVFGFIIGTVSGFFGYTTDEGSAGVQRAATNSVVLSSLLIILADVVLVKAIFFLFPRTAL
jgi:phospholipid/cholesterol/gamma-HCH transport system permease protein